MRRINCSLLAACLILGACAGHPRPPQPSSVAVPATALRATDHDAVSSVAPQATAFTRQASTYSAEQPPQCRLARFAAAAQAPSTSPEFLVLSGGSLNGAFGAGFFLGLQESGRLPPEPRVVTGVSTGSLQATMLFLARQPVAADRRTAWQGGMASDDPSPEGPGWPAVRPGRSNIEDLAFAYSIRHEGEILKVVPFGGLGMLVSGSKGDLSPLRRRLLAMITPETIGQVAFEACRGRKLYVGVTNVDDGQGYALDLTALALRAFDGDATAKLMTMVRESYVESLVASSSVPVGAKPVTLRIRDFDTNQHRRNLFIDGGARFGVFLREVHAAHALAANAGGPAGGVTLIVNTRLAIKPWHDGDLSSPRNPWLMTTLGLRAVDILENQVYRLSVEVVEDKAASFGALRMATLSNEHIPGGVVPDDHPYRGKACKDWHEADEAAAHPVQFYPSYMACLIDYGRRRGRLGEWNTFRP